MPSSEKKSRVILAWIAKAESDLVAADHLLTAGERAPLDAVCFHAQQCVEKYLKAVLIDRSIEFPRVHDLRQILTLMPRGHGISLSGHDADTLSSYAVGARYPGESDPIERWEAEEAVRLAHGVRTAVRRHFRSGALRTKPPLRRRKTARPPKSP